MKINRKILLLLVIVVVIAISLKLMLWKNSAIGVNVEGFNGRSINIEKGEIITLNTKCQFNCSVDYEKKSIMLIKKWHESSPKKVDGKHLYGGGNTYYWSFVATRTGTSNIEVVQDLPGADNGKTNVGQMNIVVE